MPKRTVSVSLDADIVDKIESLTKVPIEQVALELLNGFLVDGRRRQIPMVTLGISWPVDWYKAMLAQWGENKIAQNVRLILRKAIMKDPNRGDFVPVSNPELRDRQQKRVTSRKIRVRPDGQTFTGEIVIPEDWSDWLELHYPKKRSTYVKYFIFQEIQTWPKKTAFSIPQGMLKFESDFL